MSMAEGGLCLFDQSPEQNQQIFFGITDDLEMVVMSGKRIAPAAGTAWAAMGFAYTASSSHRTAPISALTLVSRLPRAGISSIGKGLA
jgi:hypothetical protein